MLSLACFQLRVVVSFVLKRRGGGVPVPGLSLRQACNCMSGTRGASEVRDHREIPVGKAQAPMLWNREQSGSRFFGGDCVVLHELDL